MRKLVKVFSWITAMAIAAMLSGCAAVCGTDEQALVVPPPPPPKKWEGAPVPVSEVPRAPILPTTYVVEKCDDLWSIAAKPQIYQDALLWSCIYNANKAKIKNPNKLKEGTVLSIPRDLTDAQKAICRAKAHKFPKFLFPKGAKRYCPPK